MEVDIDASGDEHLDIIGLLNPKKHDKDILSITNAAVSAVASRQQTKPTEFFVENGQKSHQVGKENVSVLDNSLSNSRLLSQSAMDTSSFNGKQKVRVPSRLLREIKSPLNQSICAENIMMSSDEPASTTRTSSSLFTSSSSSNQSSIQGTGPVPTVIKYSSDPPRLEHKVVVEPHDRSTTRSHHHHRHHTSPVVVKHTTKKYAVPSPVPYHVAESGQRSGSKQSTSKPIPVQTPGPHHVFESGRTSSKQSTHASNPDQEPGHGHVMKSERSVGPTRSAPKPNPDQELGVSVVSPQPTPKGSEKGLRCGKSHTEENVTTTIGDVQDNISNGKNIEMAPQRSVNETRDLLSTRKPKEPSVKVHGTALCQGAPSKHFIQVEGSEKGQVKAVSFSLSDKKEATREMLSKRQDHKAAVRRVVQPKMVTAPTLREPQKAENAVPFDVDQENCGTSVGNVPAVLETRLGDLLSTLDAIEAKCQESREWQVLQHQELERDLKQRDERRLQNLEDMQRQLLECQLKYGGSAPVVTPYPYPTPASVGGTTHGLSTIHEQPRHPQQPSSIIAQYQHPTQHQHLTTHGTQPTTITSTQEQGSTTTTTIQSHHTQPSRTGSTMQNVVQGTTGNPPLYNVALEHKTPSAFKTSVYSIPTERTSTTGMKRKLVRNTRTQTSPQYSSPSSSSTDLSSSPLETPLPRKKPPVPTARVSSKERDTDRKHVHFDDTPKTKPQKLGKEKESQRDIAPNMRTMGASSSPHDTAYHHISPRTSVSPLKQAARSDYIVNDIGKLRQELRHALKETEQTKLSLRNLHENIHAQISDEDVLSVPDHTKPYPLDAYLRATRDIPEQPTSPKSEETAFPDGGKPSEGVHYADALSILRDVQKRKDTLESNMESLTRQHEEEHLYRLVDDISNEGMTSEAMRLRKEVAKKIEELSVVVQTELQEEDKRQSLEREATKATETKKAVKFGARSVGIPTSAERRAKLRSTGNQVRVKTVVKAKQPPAKTVAKQPVAKRPLEGASYVSRVYGRNDHMPRRTTLKSPHVQHQSPVAPPRQAQPLRNQPKHYERRNDSSSTLSDDSRIIQDTSKPHKTPRYYFQPSLLTSAATLKPHLKHIQTPVPGQLLSMAIPLGKPKTDPSLRLPVSISEAEPSEPSAIKALSTRMLVQQPNVAVITIKDDASFCEDDDEGAKKTKKAKDKTSLKTQILPNVDIDSSSASDVSTSRHIIGARIMPCPEPPRRPGASEYEEFKDYEGVTSVHEMEDDSDQEVVANVISLHGASERREAASYQGPAFPPRNMPASSTDGLRGVVPREKSVNEAVEEKALEWIEKELLARVVSEMAPPRPDPTLTVRRSQSIASSSTDGSEPDLLAAIGLRGVQLFVDAGVPVDNELVRTLILEVLKEKVATVLGYPVPEREPPSPPDQPADDYTDIETESEEASRVETPVRTPSAPRSPPTSHPGSHVETPEQTLTSEMSSLSPSDQVEVVQVDQDDNEMEEGPLDETLHGSPVPTPVVTPTVSPQPSPVRTPEPSEQELPESENTGIVTPEISEQKSLVESPEEELKEQTFVDDVSEEEADKTVDVVPPVKVVRVEPSEPSEAAVTNSPSSITTTTTYSTRSTMGTVATDDEISEGEQLQPLVHVGQYSEGEFVAPNAMASGLDHLTTMHDIPDDIFDSLDNRDKTRDVFKDAVTGLLRDEVEPDERTGIEPGELSDVTNDVSSVDDHRKIPMGTQASNGEDISRSEGEVDRDIVATLLRKIRQPPAQNLEAPRPREPRSAISDTPSVGELLGEAELSPVWRPLAKMLSATDLSPGEMNTSAAQGPPRMPQHDESRAQGSSIVDSDENNNESERSDSVSDLQNQTWDTNDIVPKKPSSLGLVSQGSSGITSFPRVVRVAEAPAENASPRKNRPAGYQGNVTMETIPDFETGILDPVEKTSTHAQTPRLELTLPSSEPPGDHTAGDSDEPLTFEYEDTLGETSSISGGELP